MSDNNRWWVHRSPFKEDMLLAHFRSQMSDVTVERERLRGKHPAELKKYEAFLLEQDAEDDGCAKARELVEMMGCSL